MKNTAGCLLSDDRRGSKRRGNKSDGKRQSAHPVLLSYVAPERGRTETIECQGKDLSLAGMGLYLPITLPTSQVRLGLSTSTHPEAVSVSGSVVRIQRWDDQLFEVGVLFD